MKFKYFLKDIFTIAFTIFLIISVKKYNKLHLVKGTFKYNKFY